MRANKGLRHRLGKAFALQAAFISVAAILGVYVASFAIEELLIKRALKEEAKYFWQLYDQNPASGVPNTLNLTGYMFDGSQNELPAMFDGLGLGFHQMPTQADFSVVYVSEHAGRRLFLTFDGEKVSELALYFGLLPLACGLAVVYLTSWAAFRTTRRAVSPIVALAREVHDYDPSASPVEIFQPKSPIRDDDEEVQLLSEALQRLSHRTKDFVERERNFTRDASHELRSPLAVIQLASDMLKTEQELEKPAQKSVERIKRAARDMEELITAFLLLARESDQQLEGETVTINDIVKDELEMAELLIADKPITINQVVGAKITVKAPPRVVSVMIGNLIRNAFDYTNAGTVEVTLEARRFVVEDSGIGMEEEDLKNAFKPFFRAPKRMRGGHGVGLTIVKRLSDRFGWPVTIDSQPGHGTRVQVDFPDAHSSPI